MSSAARIRHMPEAVSLGQHYNMTIGHLTLNYAEPEYEKTSGRRVMGFPVAPWQRPLVWSIDQKVSFIESIWRGLPLGTYTYNMRAGSKYDGIIIDGQQRLNAMQGYIEDAFEVFGYYFSELTVVDKRVFDSTIFANYITKEDDEKYLREYYNLMNFGGTAHEEGDRA